MDPPSYAEARQLPPPSYDASLNSPSTPPPTYGEAVNFVPNHFPVLTLPTVPQHNSGIIIHPTTEVGVPVVVNHSINLSPTTPVVIYQPQPLSSTVIPSQLTDSPGRVVCPHCGRTATTRVRNVPGGGAWCFCVLLAVMGLVCGFCLIPLFCRSLQDAHHSCPHCDKVLHIYKR